MIDVLVREQNPVGVRDLLRRERQRHLPLEVRCVELLNRIGQIGVEVERHAREGKPATGLAQHRQRYAHGSSHHSAV